MKSYGYWTYEHCKEEVLKYSDSTIRKLREESGGCYDAIWRNKWNELLDIIKNNRKDKYYRKLSYIIYVYEITERNAAYIGLTSQPLRMRNSQHLQKSKNNKDTVALFCEREKINPPYPKMLEENLNVDNVQEREDYWLNFYKDNGWLILNRSKTGKKTGSLGGMRIIWNYETCKEEAAKYESRVAFEKGTSRAYQVSRKNGWMDEFFPILTRKPNGYWNYERCKEAASKCENRKEFMEKYPSAYSVSKNKKYIKDFFNKNR